MSEQYKAIMQGKAPIMTKNAASTEKTVTPKDVAEMAAEEKLVTPTVPQQSEAPTEEQADEQPELTLDEGGKKSFKDRLKDLTEQLEKNKKAIAVLGSVAAVVAVALVKAAKKKTVEVVVMSEEDEQVLADAKDESEQLSENA